MVTKGRKKQHCSGLNDAQEEMLREIVGQVAGKWPMWTLYELSQSDEPLRFARLLERVTGVSQKMLTQTLRQLERDGLITRTVYPEVPPRVEYALTEDGRELMEQFTPFWFWIAGKIPNFEQSRAQFDEGRTLSLKPSSNNGLPRRPRQLTRS
ncbi:transcriptional regulator [bacterium]|nr:MAG: transcriptional regulator [bacterium]